MELFFLYMEQIMIFKIWNFLSLFAKTETQRVAVIELDMHLLYRK